mmetsp:Transcript_86877/g.106558  ORF Transcript_86877/g.106558 Transcript_86877/m.106558 type:complete len:198 (+) Transcript_86877:85-678(+)
MADSTKQDQDYKIVVLGGGGVGKSALTIRLVTDNFLDEYDPTIEDSYQCGLSVDGVREELDILDTAGQDQFEALQDHWIRESDAFLLVYSITNKRTLEHCQTLYKKIKRNKENRYIALVLVGNKSDLPKDVRQVTYDEGKKVATKLGNAKFYETSAKTGDGVRQAFEEVVREMKKAPSPKPIKPNNNGGLCKDCIIL